MKFTTKDGVNITPQVQDLTLEPEEAIYGRPRTTSPTSGISEFVSDEDPYGLLTKVNALPLGAETHLVGFYVDDVNALESRKGMTEDLCRDLRAGGSPSTSTGH